MRSETTKFEGIGNVNRKGTGVISKDFFRFLLRGFAFGFGPDLLLLMTFTVWFIVCGIGSCFCSSTDELVPSVSCWEVEVLDVDCSAFLESFASAFLADLGILLRF